MSTNRLYKLESSTREEYWVDDPVIPNRFSGGGGSPTPPPVIPPNGSIPSWRTSSGGFSPPNPRRRGGGGGGGDNDNSDYILFSDLMGDLDTAGANSSDITGDTVVNDIPSDDGGDGGGPY